MSKHSFDIKVRKIDDQSCSSATLPPYLKDDMYNCSFLLCLIAIASPLLAETFTADKVISALKLGAPVDAILAQIVAPENTVASMSSADLDKLHAAGVAPAVIDAMLSKASALVPPSPMAQPDNTGLVDLVKLFKSGLSEKIIADQIVTNGVAQKPSVTDLLYLKQNDIPEIIISALMNAPIKGDQYSIASDKSLQNQHHELDTTATFEGLIFKKFFRDRHGKLILEGDNLQWRDANSASGNFELFLNGVKQIRLYGTTKDAGPFFYKVVIEFTKGHDYDFVDGKKDMGGNESLVSLIDTLKARFPQITFLEKVK